MTTAKRFTINGKEIIQNKQVWCVANSEHCADVIATAMNELAEENEQLKYQNEMLSDELQQCKAVINKKWSKYLKKKEKEVE